MQEYDEKRVDDTTLALLHLVTFTDSGSHRAWKGFDRSTLTRLHEAGLISNPMSKAKSVRITDEGASRSEELFREMFCRN